MEFLEQTRTHLKEKSYEPSYFQVPHIRWDFGQESRKEGRATREFAHSLWLPNSTVTVGTQLTLTG
eukprot:8440780-Prorocentrum_lima.AAC.1